MKHMKHMETFIVGVAEGVWASGLAKSDAQYVLRHMLVYMHLAYSEYLCLTKTRVDIRTQAKKEEPTLESKARMQGGPV